MPRLALVLVATLLALVGCVSAPEHCRGCLAALSDAGPDVRIVEGGTGSGGSGGGPIPVGSGGVIGTGGLVGPGGSSGVGGAIGSGGRGGGAGAGTAGSGTGGRGTGGASTGGAGTGGATATGGRGAGGSGAGGSGTGGVTDQGLVLRYRFDESSGTVAGDSSGFPGGPRNGTLMNAGNGVPTFAAIPPLQIGTHYLNLPGTSNVNGGYVVVPNLQTLTPGAVTIAVWVYIVTDAAWERVFDYGITPATGGPAISMYLTTHQVTPMMPNSVRFTITTTGNDAQQQSIDSGILLSMNTWHHLAVVLPAGATYTGTLYINGIAAATRTAMTLHPSALTGAGTPYSYIGRSGFPADPYFGGRLDDFRVYNRELSAAEIATLFSLR